MSMNATFIQVDPAELAKFQADPSLVEALFEGDTLVPPAMIALTKTMQERVRTAGPQLLAGALSQLDPALRKQIEESLGRTTAALAAGAGGDDILKLMEQRRTRGGGPASSAGSRAVLSLDKAWHGVHYLLCGEVEPGTALLSQPVLGGAALGDDDEGFSGYGPARYLTAKQVAELSQAMSRPELESQAAARFDAARMSQLSIYPGWRPSDAEWVMDGFRRLRDFYTDAASKGRAIVTCLV
jgi:hypothetical protein